MPKKPTAAAANRRDQHIDEKLVQLEKLLQLQAEINGKLLENMNTLLIDMAERKAEAAPAPTLILPPRLTN